MALTTMVARFTAAATLALGLAAASPAGAYMWPFVRYSEADGMPIDSVLGMAQDPRGSLWFATRVGLVHYDGAAWRTLDVASGMPVAWQRDIAFDRQGRLWTVSQSAPARLSRYDGSQWEQLPQVADLDRRELPLQLVAGHDADGGVAMAVRCRNDAVLVWADGRWRRPQLPGTGAVHGIAWLGSDLYIAAAQGLYRASPPFDQAPAVRVAGLPPGTVYSAVALGSPGLLRVAGDGWLGLLGPGGFRQELADPALHLGDLNDGVVSACDSLGGTYLGTERAVLYYHPLIGIEHLRHSHGLVSGGASDLLVDREGQAWFGNTRGVSKLPGRRLRTFTASDGLLADEVSSVLQRRDGTMVFGHGDGLTFMKPEPRTLRLVAAGHSWSRTMDLHEDPDGTLWGAMDTCGLVRIAGDGSLRWYDVADGLESAVFAVTRDPAGTLWVGTAQGLYRLVDDRLVELELSRWIPVHKPGIRKLVVKRDGTLLAATVQDGVIHVADGRCRQWTGEAGLGTHSTYGVSEDADGTVWVATSYGLCRLQDGQIVPATAPGPEVRGPVFAVTPDGDGHLWLGTSTGARRWDGRRLQTFSVVDGLAGAETNRDALTVDDEGRIWIGTDRGVSLFDERLAGMPNVPIHLEITGLEADGLHLPPATGYRLPPRLHELVIRFSAPAFADESRLRISTMLEGFDANWSSPAPNTSRSVRYTNLPPGRYRFRVRAEDVHGRVSPVVISDEIEVAAPFTARPWFFALVATAVLAIVWLVMSYLNSRDYGRRLAADVADRTSALERSESLVRAESQRLAAVLASISDGVLAVGADSRITLANPAAAALLGQTHTALKGKALAEVMPGLDGLLATAGRGPEAAAAAGPHVTYRFESDAGAIDFDCAVAPLSQAGGDGGLVLAFRDDTERRRTEQAAIRTQKLESLGVLAGGIAHDFNNLLTVIMGNASLLEMACPAEQRRPLEQIGTAAVRAQRLTAQLLTFARGGSPQKKLTDLRTLLRDVATLAVSGTNVSLVADLPDDLWHAEVDPGQMEQVISNLLINARQAMPDGGRVWMAARNTARTEADGEPGLQVEIRIRDEGCGIGPADLERIFEPYFTTKQTGTGLGLAITHSIVARHGGSMRVASDAGRGAEFTLLLPASRERAGATAIVGATAPAGGRRLLVLDDETSVRELLKALLRQLGHEVVTVGDGDAALEAWRKAREDGRPFTAAIMDLTIPGGLGGRETMARLRELDPTARAIVTSGYFQDPVMADFARYGFAAKLPKPFNGEDVARALRKALGAADA